MVSRGLTASENRNSFLLQPGCDFYSPEARVSVESILKFMPALSQF